MTRFNEDAYQSHRALLVSLRDLLDEQIKHLDRSRDVALIWEYESRRAILAILTGENDRLDS